ncbi:MAG: hypothetical protein OXR73_15590 [Myxococcales bacterium]|nr:hypothetical protein [Myxococcales bacterium]
MQTKSIQGHAVLLGWLLVWSTAPAVVAAQTSDDESGETGQAASTAQPAAHGQDANDFVPSEPLGATAEREHVDSKPPDDLGLSRFPDRVIREGFTMEIGIGLAFTHLSFDLPSGVVLGVARETEFGLAPPSLSLGGFLYQDLALVFRIAGTSWFSDRVPGRTIMFQSTFVGGAIQYWLSNSLFLGAGIGLALLDNYLFSDDVESNTGLMLTGRVGYSFYHNSGHSFALVGEFFPAFYDDATSCGLAANLEWQLL